MLPTIRLFKLMKGFLAWGTASERDQAGATIAVDSLVVQVVITWLEYTVWIVG